jgi:hypothetical protein
MVAAGTAFAGCPVPASGKPTPPPHSKPAWEYSSDTIEVPAGYGCKDKVILKAWGHVRQPYEITKHGRTYIVVEAAKDFKTSLYNPKTHKKVVKDNSGDFYDRLVKNGRDSKTIGKGANILFGRGVKGIVWVNGYQKLYIKNYETQKQKMTIQAVRGKYIELCAKVGSKPVNGKNLPLPSTA